MTVLLPSLPTLLTLAAVAGLGFFAWGFVEYLIHGVLAHRFKTFVTPLHWGHHREPHAVFTSPLAWVPAALLIFGVLVSGLGVAFAAAAMVGLLAGFARYERWHWRIHFRSPRNARERLLRAHHLAHHYRNPRAYHGVTTRLWDRAFGTLPEQWRADYARVEDRPPLEGASNLRSLFSPAVLLRGRRAAGRDAAGSGQ